MAMQPSVAVMDERYSLTFSDAVHACVRVFASGRLPTMPRARMNVLRAFSRAWVRAFAHGRLTTMPRASVAVLRSFSPTCVLRSHMDVFPQCRVGVSPFCVRSRVHACCVRTCLRMWTSRVHSHGLVCCVRTCLRMWTSHVRASHVRAFSRTCVLRAYVLAYVDVSRAYVPSILNVSSFHF